MKVPMPGAAENIARACAGRGSLVGKISSGKARGLVRGPGKVVGGEGIEFITQERVRKRWASHEPRHHPE
jgi:hypothetical protein